MKIGTWNVEYAAGDKKNELRLKRLLQMNCDVWVLTETNADLDLSNAGFKPVRTTPRKPGRTGSCWTTIWSRLPVVKVVPTEDPNRTVAAILQAPFGELLVFGTVLPWHSDKGDKGTVKNWEEFYRVVPLQGREWARLRKEHPDAEMCVAGDLNMNLGGPHYYGTKKGRAMLGEAFAAADLVCLTETEKTKGMLSHGAIDHICVSSRLAEGAGAVDAWEGKDADGVRLSDHSGVVVSVGSKVLTTGEH